MADAAAALLRTPAVPSPKRPADVVVRGLLYALDALPAPDSVNLKLLLRGELERKPLHPVPRVHDDERLLLGVAAVTPRFPDLAALVASTLRPGEGLSRQATLLLGARHLASVTDVHDNFRDILTALNQCVSMSLSFRESTPLLWLASELLDSREWQPDDDTLRLVGDAIQKLRRTILIESPAEIEPLDGALIIRGIGVTLPERYVRRSYVDAVLAIIESFPVSARILACRPRGRSSVTLEDEYDVQWLLHALLYHAIPDIQPEDPAPRLAGRSSRLDFTSRRARLGIEVKHVRRKNDAQRMREELMVDERQYQEHPYVDTVVAIVHDPSEHIPLADRPAFERDLSGPITVGGRTVNYVTRVR